MAETWSDGAKELMCGLFAFGRGTVKSHPPHATLTKNKAAFDELQAAGLIRKEPFNQFDVWLYSPEPALEAEAQKHRKWYWARHAFTAPQPSGDRNG